MTGWVYLLFIASEWIIRIVMTLAITRRRRVSTAMSWLLLVYFVPWIGLAAYLLIGENTLGRKRSLRYANSLRDLAGKQRAQIDDPAIVEPTIAPEQHDLIRLSETLGGMGILGGNDAILLTDSDEVIRRLIADIERAEHHVHMLYYVFRPDATGRRVADALRAAARRSVACRVLADGVGSSDLFKSLAGEMRRDGVDVRPALPVNLLRQAFQRMDLRNHRKVAIIDGKTAYAGSQNIVDATYGHRRFGTWQDMTVLLRGPAVLQSQAVFLDDWCFETGESDIDGQMFPAPSVVGETPIQTVPSGPLYETESLQKLLLAAIHEATERIIITSPYLVPDESFLLALRLATLRGVEIDIVIPRRSNHPLVHAAARAYFTELFEIGVRLHEHTHGLLHAKTMSVDNAFALIGSSNFDIRSFYLNFEMNLILYGANAAADLRSKQFQYIAQSDQIDSAAWRRERGHREILDNLAKLFSPLL